MPPPFLIFGRAEEGINMNSSVIRCRKCVLPENYPGLSFDGTGLCSECREHAKRFGDVNWDLRGEKLKNILDRYRGRGSGKYDCLVPFSGGKDSSYTLQLMVKQYGMTPLAFNVDNGFANPEAVDFMKEHTSRLGVDLEIYHPSSDLLKRVYRHAMERTGEFCSACVVLIPTAINRAAWEKGIRLVIGSFCEMTEKPPAAMANMDGVRFWNIMKDRFTRRELEKDFFFPAWKRLLGIRYIDIPDFIRWDVPGIHRILAREAGFTRAVSDFRYDCRATPHSNYLFNMIAGYGKMDFLLAGMVRSGFMERGSALDALNRFDPSSPPAGFHDLMDEIGCRRDVLAHTEGIRAADFPGRNPLLRRIAGLLRKALD